jgi:hypothetical protein
MVESCAEVEQEQTSTHCFEMGTTREEKERKAIGTWRRTVEDEMASAGKSWNETSWLAHDRDGWRRFVGALCSTRSEED